MFGSISRGLLTGARYAPALRAGVYRSNFCQAQRYYAAEASTGKGLKLFFASPDNIIASGDDVQLVTVPGSEGYFGIAPDHVHTITQLNPGLVTVTKPGAADAKYFVSSGFVVVENSVVNISAVEAVPTDQIDKAAAQAALDAANKRLANAKTEQKKTEAQIAVDVLTTALQYAE